MCHMNILLNAKICRNNNGCIATDAFVVCIYLQKLQQRLTHIIETYHVHHKHNWSDNLDGCNHVVLYNGSIGRVRGSHSPPNRLPDGFTKVTDTGDHQQGAQNLQKVERKGKETGEEGRRIQREERLSK